MIEILVVVVVVVISKELSLFDVFFVPVNKVIALLLFCSNTLFFFDPHPFLFSLLLLSNAFLL